MSSITMGSKKDFLGRLVCGAVVGAMALMPIAVQADESMGGSGTAMAQTPSTPTLVSGQVVRYYVDAVGYVTAMDVQTATGTSIVHFPSSMGQQLYANYPVGSKIDVWVTPSIGWHDRTLWNVVGVGANKPMSWMQIPVISPISILEAPPYIVAGSRPIAVSGNLRRLVVGRNGEVLAIVLDNGALIRVPPEMRHIAPGYAGSDRVTPLFKGALVQATGYLEAPVYGVLSPYSPRLASDTITVDGHSVGVLGVPQMARRSETLFSWDIGGTTLNNDELSAMRMGYEPYNTTPGVASPAMAPAANSNG